MRTIRHRLVCLLALAALRVDLSAQQHPPQPAINFGDTSILDALGATGCFF